MNGRLPPQHPVLGSLSDADSGASAVLLAWLFRKLFKYYHVALGGAGAIGAQRSSDRAADRERQRAKAGQDFLRGVLEPLTRCKSVTGARQALGEYIKCQKASNTHSAELVLDAVQSRVVAPDALADDWIVASGSLAAWFELRPILIDLEGWGAHGAQLDRNIEICGKLKARLAKQDNSTIAMIDEITENLRDLLAAIPHGGTGLARFSSRREVDRWLADHGDRWPPLEIARWVSEQSRDRPEIGSLLRSAAEGAFDARLQQLRRVAAAENDDTLARLLITWEIWSRLESRFSPESSMVESFCRVAERIEADRLGRLSRRIDAPEVARWSEAVGEGPSRTLKSCWIYRGTGEAPQLLEEGRHVSPRSPHSLIVALDRLAHHPSASAALCRHAQDLSLRLSGLDDLDVLGRAKRTSEDGPAASKEQGEIYYVAAMAIAETANSREARMSLQPATDALLLALAEIGLYFEPVEVSVEQAAQVRRANEVSWLLLPVEHEAAGGLSPGASTWALRFRDGQAILPAIWLQTARRWAESRSAIQTVLASQPQLFHVRRRWPALNAWRLMDDALGVLVTDAVARSDELYYHAAARVFAALYNAYMDLPDQGVNSRKTVWGIAAGYYRALDDNARERVGPLLEETTLLPNRERLLADLALGLTADCLVEWEGATGRPVAHGTPLRLRFSDDGIAHITLALGVEAPPEIARWLALPPPSALVDGDGKPDAGPLATFFDRVAVSPLVVSQAATELSEAKAELVRTLADTALRSWQDRFVRRATGWQGEVDCAAQSWLATLGDLLGLQPWPRVAGEGHPAYVPVADEAVRSLNWPTRFSDAVPANFVLEDEPIAFGLLPAAATATLSRGPRRLGSLSDLSNRLVELSRDASADLAQFATRIDRLSDLHERLGETLDDAATTLNQFLASLLAWNGSRQHAGDVLTVAREWASAAQLTIEPVSWRMDIEELPIAAPSDDLPAEFSDTPRGQVRLRAFGVRRADGAGTSADVYVSAGPPPYGYDRLLSLVAQRPEWLMRFEYWPRAALQGAVDSVAEQLYIDLWNVDEAACDRVILQMREQVASMLSDEFKYATFLPETYRQFPENWLTVIAPNGVRRERVVRVLRPGLRTADGSLRVSAIVEVE